MTYSTGYDMDGVIADFDSTMGQSEFHKNIESAELLLKPKGRFVIITARRNTPKTVEITKKWLLNKFGYLPKVVFRPKDAEQSKEAIAKYKVSKLKLYKVKEYYEDQTDLLTYMAELYPACEYFQVTADKQGIVVKPFVL